jgi:hypothetical protein
MPEGLFFPEIDLDEPYGAVYIVSIEMFCVATLLCPHIEGQVQPAGIFCPHPDCAGHMTINASAARRTKP